MRKDLNYYYNKFKYGEDIFHYLMANRVKEILLVSPFYDAFIFEQDGRLSEQIFGEYRQLNLSTEPMVTSVPSGEAALEMIEKRNFDLVITMLHTGTITPYELAKRIKQKRPNLPVLLLLSTLSDIKIAESSDERLKHLDNIFLWKGDTKLFLAMVKYVEDLRNLEYDTKHGLVRVILLVEDSIQFYSLFLPLLYEEIMKQTQILIQEEISDTYKRLRMRARPKVILTNNLEQAEAIYEKYKQYIIAVISDTSFFRAGQVDPEAGLKLIHNVKSDGFDVPTILLSSELENKSKADQVNSTFIYKYSKHLLAQLRSFIIENLGFGDFVFRKESGEEISRAATMAEFEDRLREVPTESLIFHSKRNHFSTWLMARGEIPIARKIKPLTIQDFPSPEGLRTLLLVTIENIKKSRNEGKIVDFRPDSLPKMNQVIRLSEGSLGGKGRGLAFLNALLVAMDFEESFPDIRISLPRTAIIGTNEYDFFLQNNNIDQRELETLSDEAIDQIFLHGYLSNQLVKRLKIFLEFVDYPIAIRSSSLLEDSFAQPLAGIYRTYMLPNNGAKKIRLRQLTDAIKLVFASVFIHFAREYVENLQHQVEEEKMAVIIQEIVGHPYGDKYFYPHISGVAQSYNFYPIADLKHEDGLASIATGLGRTVIEGGKTFRFCPKYPKIEFLQQKTLLVDSQKEFYALELKENGYDLAQGDDITLAKLPIEEAAQNGALAYLASTWDYQDHHFIPGIQKQGQVVITFDHIMKYNYFPLAEIIENLLDIGQTAFGIPVEIEFAVDLTEDRSQNILPTFDILQIRPLGVSEDEIDFTWEKIDKENVFLYTEHGMGNGFIRNIKDIIYIDSERFDKLRTIEMQQEIAALNAGMKSENREYILIGPGRWGSQDRFLGIPVKFVQISQARAIIEIGLEDFNVDPSQGTHFFHNMVAMKIGYFTIPYRSQKDSIDWDWLGAQKIHQRTNYFVHVRLAQEMEIKMDGKTGLATISKPQLGKSTGS